MLTDKIKNYARLLVEKGIALQEGQPILINAEIINAPFVRVLVKEAYSLGAKEVIVNWRDGEITKARLLHASEDVLSNPKSWISEYYHNMLDDNVGIISLVSANPKLLEGIPAERISKSSRSVGKVLRFFNDAVMSSELTWCVAAVPSLLWANLIGLEGSDTEKINKLWTIILKLCRIDGVSDDENFATHMTNLANRTDYLNKLSLKTLKYTCTNGTSFTLDLPTNHIWQGGAEESKKGIIFNANIPTEEVFSAPLKTGVNGVVHNTMPLIYQGNTIDKFTLTFKDGKVVDYSAKIGAEFLKELLTTDDGSSYLGEVALVDHYSPISQSNTIYFETLFDENASCHLALGAAYPICLTNGSNMNDDELKNAGLNRSITHVDFMIGHKDMCITGITSTGKEVLIMKDGHLQF